MINAEVLRDYSKYVDTFLGTSKDLSEADKTVHHVHRILLSHFRDLQLRARDGESRAEDVKWMQTHMNQATSSQDFVAHISSICSPLKSNAAKSTRLSSEAKFR